MWKATRPNGAPLNKPSRSTKVRNGPMQSHIDVQGLNKQSNQCNKSLLKMPTKSTEVKKKMELQDRCADSGPRC